MLLKSCARCRALVPYPNVYCDTCRPIAEEEKRLAFQEKKKKWNARYNQKRNPKYIKFYGSMDWKRLSKAKMQDAGYRCEECGAIAVEVHHVDPIQTESGWERRLDWTNLKAVCLNCHNKAHGRFQSRRRKRAGGGESINRLYSQSISFTLFCYLHVLAGQRITLFAFALIMFLLSNRQSA